MTVYSSFNRNFASVLYHFRVTVSHLSKVVNFNLPPAFGVPTSDLNQILQILFWHQKIKSPWAIVWQCLPDPKFSHFNTILVCDRDT